MANTSHRSFLLPLAIALVCLSSTHAQSQDEGTSEVNINPSRYPWIPPGRVVAIGDMHGDLENALQTLRLAGVIDDSDPANWIGGDTTLVQTGDITDRGPHSAQLVDLLRHLTEEAPKHGGHVVHLLGNHELMNLQGNLAYVHPQEYVQFGGHQQRLNAFLADGEYGSYLSSLDVIAIVGDSLFTHAGLAPDLAETHSVDGINQAVKEMLSKDAFGRTAVPEQRALLGNSGPLWTRAFDTRFARRSKICPLVKKTLESVQAKRMVIGHNVQAQGVPQRECDGQLWLIDVGMSQYYGGNIAAIEIHTDGRVEILQDVVSTEKQEL